MAAGSSRSRKQFAYDVFLSFRGEDVRKSFINHLRHALTQRGITVFYDDTGLQRGEEIQSKLYEAIESSKVAIVTFSRRYANSRWCLDELVKITECRRSHGLIVLAVFYDVDPANVRKQSASYREAFRKLEANYGDERVKKWRQALKTAADLAGFVLQHQANGYEGQFIQHIVKEVERKLDARLLDIPKYMVGAESSLIRQISTWLQNGSSQVEVGIIYGPGGVGKTTTAKVVYNENHRTFESSSFLVGVRTALGNETEFIRLQKQLIRNITGKEVIDIDSVPEGRQKIKKAIGTKKILVVLDDVDEEVGLHKMFDCSDWFFSGSKILITTRNQHFQINNKSIARFEACLLDKKCSVGLFSYHAFGQPAPPENYLNISMSFIEYCDGLPLALEVLASSLQSIRFEMWEHEFARLEKYLDEEVNNVLKWSFDSIQQSTVKDIFLHIAFYMVGMEKESALQILDGCGLHGKIGLENLIGKCLVSIEKNSDTLNMHHLIQQMGYEVVRLESHIELGRRSRLLGQMDAYEVLWKKNGEEIKSSLIHLCATQAVKGLSLKIPDALDIDISSEGSYAGDPAKRMLMTYTPTKPSRQVPRQFRPIKTDAFTKMNNLNLLLLENVKLEGGYEDFPKGIKWLSWLGCPLKEIPLDFYFDELVVLDMQKSCLVHAWSGWKYIGALKVLNLSHSRHLWITPDLSGAHMLEWISCEDCTSLLEVHESIGKLENLTHSNFDGCINLVTMPESNGNFRKLTRVTLKDCRNLRNLPINMLVSAEYLDLEGCHTLFKRSDQVEPSAATVLENSTNIIIPAASEACPVPWPPPPLPFNICLPSLKRLFLINCGISGDEIMEMMSFAPSLELVDLSNNPIGVIRNTTGSRPCLKLGYLGLKNCGVSRVDDMGLMSLAPSLSYLELSNNPIRVMDNMNRAVHPKLEMLLLNNCPNLESISNISRDILLEADHSHSLKRITYYEGGRTIKEKQRHLIEANDYQNQVEIEYGISDDVIIEWISEMNEARASYLRFPNLNTFHCAGRQRGFYERGIYQAGVYIVLLRGNHMAEWFPTTITCRRANSVSSVSYRVPSFHPDNGWSIRGLNVGFCGTSNLSCIIIKNVARKWTWGYWVPYCEAINDETTTWLTHWLVTEHRQIRPGDELHMEIFGDFEYIGVQVMYVEEQIDGEGEETGEEDNDVSAAAAAASASYINLLGVEDDKEDNCDATTADLESLHDDWLNDEDSSLRKAMNSSNNISTLQDEGGSAATTSDVAVWYNNTIRSADLSFYLDDEQNECRHYTIDHPFRYQDR